MLIFMGSGVFLAISPEHPNQTLLIFWGGEYLLQFPNDGYLRLFKPSSRQWFLNNQDKNGFFVKNGEKCYLNYVMVIYSGLICDPLLLISFIFTEK